MSTTATADLVSVRPRRAAEITGLSEGTIRRLVRTGRLESRRVDSAVLIPVEAIHRLLRGEAPPATAEGPTR